MTELSSGSGAILKEKEMSGPTEEQRKKVAKEHLRFVFESSLVDRVSRQTQVRVHQMIPLDFFSSASRECREQRERKRTQAPARAVSAIG